MAAKINLEKVVITADKSWTLYSEKYGETYHSVTGAVQEAFGKFIRPCRIEQLADSETQLRILDVCFGLGYNALAAWHTVKLVNPTHELEVISLEKNADLLKGLINMTLPSPLDVYQPLLEKLINDGSYFEGNRRISLLIGDATETIDTLKGKFDAVFWDPFSPPKNPELWTAEILRKVKEIMAPKAILATYSANQRVRRGMLDAGLKIGLGPAIGRKKGGTLASIAADLPAISNKDMEKLLKVEAY